MAASSDGSIEGRFALMAGRVVEQFFPPSDIGDAYKVLVSLNLLNAMVKQPLGRKLTSYSYIKGMAACTFLWLLYHPLDGVDLWWDGKESLTYFRLCGRQFSFHFVPLLYSYTDKMKQAGLQEQVWDGLRLQVVGQELFEEIVRGDSLLGGNDNRVLLQLMRTFSSELLLQRVRNMDGVEVPPIDASALSPKQSQVEQAVKTKTKKKKEKWIGVRPRFAVHTSRVVIANRHDSVCSLSERRLCLEVALKFNIWRASCFELHRRGDSWCVRSLRYTGGNYQQMIDVIVGNHPRVEIRPKKKLKVGCSYYLCRTNRCWRRVSPSRRMLLLAHYNYLRLGFKNFNLCVTYRVALYLTRLFPDLRFVNVLNYTRMTCHRHTYGYRQLLNVPLKSQSRWRKVWLINDPDGLLEDFDVDTIPEPIVNEYLMADDYDQYFQITTKNGCEGLVAYSRFHLLRPVWAKIKLQNHYAYVMNHKHKWAIYALMQECFVSEFVYNSIWLDHERDVIVGRIDDKVVDIHELYY